MPGWDVKIRPGKDEEKEADHTWVIVVLVLAVLFGWWFWGAHSCGLYQDGVHCDSGWTQRGVYDTHSSGHHRPHHTYPAVGGGGGP